MANFSLYGILLTIGLFFFLVGVILSQINVDNPYTGLETSIFSLVIDWIIH